MHLYTACTPLIQALRVSVRKLLCHIAGIIKKKILPFTRWLSFVISCSSQFHIVNDFCCYLA